MLRIARAVCCQCSQCTQLCPRNALGLGVQPHKAMRAMTTGNGMLLGDPSAILGCSSCGLCTNYSCPMGLAPSEVMAMYKQALGATGIRPQPENEIRVDPFLEGKRVPTERLIARMGLAKYDRDAPYRAEPVKPGKVVIPLRQHIGKPSEPAVRVGDAVREGDIAYGKFLLGKSAFATAGLFRDLMNWRRSLPKYLPTGLQADVLQAIRENGSLTSAEVRRMAGLKKSASDALLTRLQMGTWIVIGDFERKFRGPNLEYSGWQLASWCPPEDLFDSAPRPGIPFPFADEDGPQWKPCSPEESRDRLLAHLRRVTGAPDALLLKFIG